MAKFIDLEGQKYGNLTVIERSKDHILPSGKPRTMWKCKCDCGNITYVSSQSLRSGTTISCGCLRKEHAKESQTKKCNKGTKRFPIFDISIGKISKYTNTFFYSLMYVS